MRTCQACGTSLEGSEAYCVSCGAPLAPTADPLIGRTIGGNFLVESLLGEGAMGKVYRARQLSLDKVVAIKILHRHLAGERTMTRRFHREARAASRLNHPNSLHIIDFGQTAEGILYIAMELVEGQDLIDVLEQAHPLQLERIARLMAQVLDALEEAHDAGIVHRDLKPENIMVVRRRDGREDVKVCDFGIAKIQDPKDGESLAPITVAGIVCGTPEYMSPEQGRGESLDGRSDLYSVGVILYQLVTGTLPYVADTALGVVTRLLTEDPRPPTVAAPGSATAEALEPVILRAMARNRAERYQCASELKADLLKVAGGARIAPFAPAGLPAALLDAPAPRPRPARVGVFLAVTAVAAAALAGGGVWLATTARSGDERAVLVVPPVGPASDASAPEPLDAGTEEAAPEADGPDGASAVLLAAGSGDAEAAPDGRDRPRRDRDRPGKASPPVERPAAPAEDPPPGPARTSAFDLGMAAFTTGDVEGAIRHFERSRQEAPGAARVHRMLGKCYYRAGQIDRGRTAYRRYLELRPDAPDRAYIEAILGG